MRGTLTQRRGSSRRPAFLFPSFTFRGSQSLAALIAFYGLERSALRPEMTLADYLARKCHGSLRSGSRVALGSAQLIALEVERGVATQVGLSLKFSPLRRLSGRYESERAGSYPGRLHYNSPGVSPWASVPPA